MQERNPEHLTLQYSAVPVHKIRLFIRCAINKIDPFTSHEALRVVWSTLLLRDSFVFSRGEICTEEYTFRNQQLRRQGTEWQTRVKSKIS
jgi:hypothetical protein